MKSDFHIRGALRVEYRVQSQNLEESVALIASEQRFAGGDGAVSALVLATLGARVRLSGNAIGTDSHGRFLLSQFQGVPNLELDIEVREDVVTPYAILIRDEAGSVQTLLSPEASELGGIRDYPQLLMALRTRLNEWSSDTTYVEQLIASYDTTFGDLNSWKDLIVQRK